MASICILSYDLNKIESLSKYLACLIFPHTEIDVDNMTFCPYTLCGQEHKLSNFLNKKQGTPTFSTV
jgi:hypothetical protein